MESFNVYPIGISKNWKLVLLHRPGYLALACKSFQNFISERSVSVQSDYITFIMMAKLDVIQD